MSKRVTIVESLVKAFGEDVIIKAIEIAKSKQRPGNIVQITNPVLRFLMNTNRVIDNKLTHIEGVRVIPSDLSYVRLLAGVVDDLSDELLANENYKDQLAEKVLSVGQGPFFSALNEVIVGAYYKNIGMKVGLNSSKEEGAADVDLIGTPYATDAKTFPNGRLYLEDIVNGSAKEIEQVANKLFNQGILISVFQNDKKKIKKSLLKLVSAFEDPNIGHYGDDVLGAMIIENTYPGADFQVSVENRKVNVFFQASWDMAYAIEEVKNSVDKAIKQAKELGKQAIPWIMVPRDAGRNGIEVSMLRFVAEFHQFVIDRPDIYILPAYSIEFEDGGFAVIVDVFQTGMNTMGVDQKSFAEFIQQIMNRPVRLL